MHVHRRHKKSRRTPVSLIVLLWEFTTDYKRIEREDCRLSLSWSHPLFQDAGDLHHALYMPSSPRTSFEVLDDDHTFLQQGPEEDTHSSFSPVNTNPRVPTSSPPATLCTGEEHIRLHPTIRPYMPSSIAAFQAYQIAPSRPATFSTGRSDLSCCHTIQKNPYALSISNSHISQGRNQLENQTIPREGRKIEGARVSADCTLADLKQHKFSNPTDPNISYKAKSSSANVLVPYPDSDEEQDDGGLHTENRHSGRIKKQVGLSTVQEIKAITSARAGRYRRDVANLGLEDYLRSTARKMG